MAFVGSSSAWAEATSVVLCKTAELPCEGSNRWPNPTSVVAHATNPKLLSSAGTVECEKSLIEVTLLNSLAKLIVGHVLSLSFEGNCHLGGTTCTVTVKELGGVTITHGANPLEWTGRAMDLPLESSSMRTRVNVHCGFLINCTYMPEAETVTSASNSASGEVSVAAEKAALERKEGFCPAFNEFDATYFALGAGLWLES